MDQPETSRPSYALDFPKRVTVIINPVSCSDRVESFEQLMLPMFEEYGCMPTFVHTQKTLPATNLAREAVASGSDMIIAAGGDGTIMQTANALIGQDVPLAIIPLGTGNLLALNLHIPLDIGQAIATAMTGLRRSIDLVQVNGGEHYFAIMGGIGFDARIMDQTDRESKQKFGRIAYLWTALQNLEGDLFHASITLDEKISVHEKVKSILVANMGLIGPNFSAFPDAKPDDGFMCVGLLKASSAPEFIRLLATTMAEGTPAPDPSFDMYKCKSIKIELTHPQLYEYDGDIEGQITHLEMRIAPKALTVMSPQPQ
jgi:diacylglycerol kinase (ATP)